MMKTEQNVTLENVFVIPNSRGLAWRDFAGVNSGAGNPSFVIRISEEQGHMLEELGDYNVKWPKDEWVRNNPDKAPNPSLKVIASYRYFAPEIRVKVNGEIINFTKEDLADLDNARISYAAVVVRGTEVNFNGRKTYAAYLQEAYFELEQPRASLNDLIADRM